jgi:A/G-specific adenine glycosylase
LSPPGADEDATLAARVAPALLEWFDHSGRHDLPWQREPTPYRVWVSEIMLQQTQVATAIPYFEVFTARFPDLASLAAAELDEVLHLWSGLGYYARARNLHRAARRIVAEHAGEFPGEFERVVALPGIGRSTAGAILALSRGERHAILDGNVKRVLTRCFAIDAQEIGPGALEQRLWALAEACTPTERAGDYGQAIMDLGATVCTRSRPACLLCPLQSQCRALATGRQDELPRPRRRAERGRREHWLVLARRAGGELLLEKRPPTGIWGGLWSLPEFPTRAHAVQWCHEHLSAASTPREEPPLAHAFSHFDCEYRPLAVRCRGLAARARDEERWRWYDPEEPARVGLPKPIAALIGRSGEDAT